MLARCIVGATAEIKNDTAERRNVTIGEQLESIIDHSSVTALLRVLETIMREKSQHIAENWQDATLARAWDMSAREVGKLAARFQTTGVPGIGR